MPKHEKELCGKWGPFLYGDKIIWKEIRWKVRKAEKETVSKGCVPIEPIDEELNAALIEPIEIPIDDALDCRA